MECICITYKKYGLETTLGDRGIFLKDKDELLKTLQDLKNKEQLINKAKEWTKTHTWEYISKEWISLFEKPSCKMFKRLNLLKESGFDPKLILDIGANVGNWNINMKKLYPNAKIKSFEANPQCEEELKRHGLDYKIVLLGDGDKEVDFYIIKDSLCTTGASIFKENTHYYDNCETMKLNMVRLDSLIKDKHIDFMKLDVQGSELLVLFGASNIIKDVDYILLEISLVEYNKGAPLMSEVISYMNSIGFKAYDIIENHYLNNICIQTDILFRNHI
jgi:FkbM family methyltransferase